MLADMSFLDTGKQVPAENGNLIGMSVLLQYGKTCFDWKEGKLHLGSLGPCESGMMPHRSWLTGSQGIAISAKVSSNELYQAKIDTGSITTYCSPWIMGQIGDRGAFSFGGSDMLAGECAYDSDILFPSWERGAESSDKHILIGMDTLNQFAAFGWRLNPLEVYFVPRAPDSDSGGS